MPSGNEHKDSNSDERPLARVFCPFFPYPGYGGSQQVVIGDLDRLTRTHRVQFITWLNSSSEIKTLRNTASIDQLPEEIELITLDVRRESNQLRRALRVLTSLFSKYSSTEQFYYPKLEKTPSLPKASLEIYHYGFCRRWLEKNLFVRAEKRIAYFHNIESELIRQRAQASSNFLIKFLLTVSKLRLKNNERWVTENVDETWFVSQTDLELAKKELGCSNGSLHLPVFTEKLKSVRYLNRNKTTRNGPFRIGLLGALNFKPNHDSAIFILRDVCPKIAAAQLDCEILIAGKDPSIEIYELAKQFAFVKILGFVENIEDFWASIDCMVVPHVSGAGIRIKMLEALNSGVPVVANPEAAYAIGDPHLFEELIVVSLENFDSAIFELQKSLGRAEPSF